MLLFTHQFEHMSFRSFHRTSKAQLSHNRRRLRKLSHKSFLVIVFLPCQLQDRHLQFKYFRREFKTQSLPFCVPSLLFYGNSHLDAIYLLKVKLKFQ